ncbi:hypothetical protein ACJJTC_013810 [Scirpophaga incertulas]
MSEAKENITVIANNLKPLCVDGNVAENWRKWRQRYCIFCDANGINTFSEQKQIAILLNLIGEDGLEIYNSFGLDRKELTFNALLERFDQKFNARKNTSGLSSVARASPRKDETIDEYVTIITNLSNSCEFNDLKESLLKDMFVIGIKNTQVKQRLLQEEKLTLEKAIQIAKSIELSKDRTTKLEQGNSQINSNTVQAIVSQNRSR